MKNQTIPHRLCYIQMRKYICSFGYQKMHRSKQRNRGLLCTRNRTAALWRKTDKCCNSSICLPKTVATATSAYRHPLWRCWRSIRKRWIRDGCSRHRKIPTRQGILRERATSSEGSFAVRAVSASASTTCAIPSQPWRWKTEWMLKPCRQRSVTCLPRPLWMSEILTQIKCKSKLLDYCMNN